MRLPSESILNSLWSHQNYCGYYYRVRTNRYTYYRYPNEPFFGYDKLVRVNNHTGDQERIYIHFVSVLKKVDIDSY